MAAAVASGVREARVWGVFLCGAIALLALVPYAHHQHPDDGVLIVDRVQFNTERSAQVDRWQTLPDDWFVSHRGAVAGWYRATVTIARVPEQRWAVYLPTVNANAAVYVNGRAIGDGGRFADPVARNSNRPLLFPVNAKDLLPGKNSIEIFVKATSVGSGYLSRIYMGPEAALAPFYDTRRAWKVNVVWVTTMGLVLLGCFMGALWVVRRQETLYGWFALGVLLWAAHNLNVLVVEMPVAGWLWDWITRFGCLHWFAIVSVMFVNRYTNRPQPRMERWLCGLGALLMLSFAILPEQIFYTLARRVWDPVMIGTGAYASLRLWRACRGERSPELLALFVASGVVIAFGVRDTLMMNHLWDREHGLYLHYAAPLAIVVIAWILLRRFAMALGALESVNVELERRVELSRRELENNYERLRALEHAQLLAHERGRLMRDMHDGVGGHLVSTIALVDSGRADTDEVAKGLRDALVDLRLTIDSLDASAGDLLGLLTNLRGRLEPRLQASSIEMRWEVDILSELPDFEPHNALNVLRIVQEAITNAIKHSAACTVTVRAMHPSPAARDTVIVEIGDDGRGITRTPAPGRGLENMRHRARSIGGELQVLTSSQGTTVRLALPVGPWGDSPEAVQPPRALLDAVG